MSQVEQMKVQLRGLADQSRQGAPSLAGFKQRFGQSSQQVQALIRGTATRADQDIATMLDAAAESVDQAVQSPQIAEAGSSGGQGIHHRQRRAAGFVRVARVAGGHQLKLGNQLAQTCSAPPKELATSGKPLDDLASTTVHNLIRRGHDATVLRQGPGLSWQQLPSSLPR
jgi:hypothetical protein